jgi:hypothetical protein
MAGLGALIVILVAVGVLLLIEGWAVRSGRKTISEDTQRLTARMDRTMIAGISFGLGALVMWFLYHFTSPPPGG